MQFARNACFLALESFPVQVPHLVIMRVFQTSRTMSNYVFASLGPFFRSLALLSASTCHDMSNSFEVRPGMTRLRGLEVSITTSLAS